jgi:hypothetical protein
MTPDDVYAKVGELRTIVSILAVLIVVQLIAKGVIFGWVISVLRRVEKLLGLVESHSRLSDENRDRLLGELQAAKAEARGTARAAAGVARAVAEDVRAAVDRVPDATVERLRGDSLGDSGKLPTVPMPPDPR